MTHNTTEDEHLDLQDDEKSSDVDEKTSDTFDVDDRLQDGARITCDPNKDSTPASLQPSDQRNTDVNQQTAWSPKAAFTRQIFVGQHVLANSKKLANSCVHTSNTRQIATYANSQTWRPWCNGTHGELPLQACFYFMFFVEETTKSDGETERFG